MTIHLTAELIALGCAGFIVSLLLGMVLGRISGRKKVEEQFRKLIRDRLMDYYCQYVEADRIKPSETERIGGYIKALQEMVPALFPRVGTNPITWFPDDREFAEAYLSLRDLIARTSF